MHKVNLHSIAQEAAVSISTASRVLNKSKGTFPISAKTQERVLAVARAQGYFPNGPAQALKQGLMNTIGIIETSSAVFREMGDSLQHYIFLSEILRGIYQSAVRREFHVMLMTGAERDFENEMHLLGKMGLVDGLLVTNRDLAKDRIFTSAMLVYPKPVVYALDYPTSKTASWVAPDDVQGGFLATRTLLDRGHRKILYARTTGFDNLCSRRIEGWRKAINSFSREDVEGRLVYAAEADLSTLVKDGYTAVVCTNLPAAELVDQSLTSAGLKTPDDMELIAFSSDVAEVLEPMVANKKWAVVSEPLSKILEAATDLLIDLITGVKPKRNQVRFPFSLVSGSSCPGAATAAGHISLQMH